VLTPQQVSPSGQLLGKILVNGCEGGVANLCFGEDEHKSTLFLLAEGAIIAIRIHGTSGALGLNRERVRLKKQLTSRLPVSLAWCGVPLGIAFLVSSMYAFMRGGGSAQA
jgi:hypothetical protein